MKENKITKELNIDNSEDHFSDLKYICNSSALMIEAIQRGLDVAQLPSGDVLITEIKVVNTQYRWDNNKQRMVKISQG